MLTNPPKSSPVDQEAATQSPATPREVRLSIRTNSEQKELLKRAALSLSTDLSHFVLEASLREARKVVADESILVLSARDYEQLYQAMDEATEPNQALQQLINQKRVWEE